MTSNVFMFCRDALRPLCDKKNIDLASVNVYVDSSKTPLPAAAHTDTYFVAGKNLIVRGKTIAIVTTTISSRFPRSLSRKSLCVYVCLMCL